MTGDVRRTPLHVGPIRGLRRETIETRLWLLARRHGWRAVIVPDGDGTDFRVVATNGRFFTTCGCQLVPGVTPLDVAVNFLRSRLDAPVASGA